MHRIILVLIAMILTIPLNAQLPINIQGTITNYNGESIIYLGNDETILPLTISKDGAFSIDMDFAQLPSFVSVKTVSGRGKITNHLPRIWFSDDNLSLDINWVEKTFDSSSKVPYQELSQEMENLKGKKQKQLILANPNQWPGLFFADRFKEDLPISDLEAFLERTTEEFSQSIYAKRIEYFIAAERMNPIKKGKALADFKLPNEQGEEIALLQSSDKPKLIALFSSGCAYSVASIQLLQKLHEEGSDQLEIITIWEDNSRDTWLNYRKDEKEDITWINLWDQYGFASTYLDRKMWPSFYVVDPEGILIDRFSGYSQKSADKIRALIKPGG